MCRNLCIPDHCRLFALRIIFDAGKLQYVQVFRELIVTLR